MSDHYERLWQGTVTTADAANLLGLLPHSFRLLADECGCKPLVGRWDVADVKKVATRLLVKGNESEKENARTALRALREGTY